MIISANSEPHKNEFNSLISATVSELNLHAQKSSKTVSRLLGRELEPYVRDVMTDLAVGSPFENTIELIGGQKFPDIIAKKFYGIEVKTTTQNHWKTTGNSVLETTRIDSVERIFMLFAKLAAPIEFKCRPYEECLSEVVVTHSPRYLIDMNLEKGKTIFDKINTPYDTLRKKDNPIKPIVEYYKSKLKPGEDLWWIEQENNYSSNIVIKMWSNLSPPEQQNIRTMAMAFFPEIFSNSREKYKNIPVWLVTKNSIVCPNIRDLFSAKGKDKIVIKDRSYPNSPRILVNLFDNIDKIIDNINTTTAIELSGYWQKNTNEKTKIYDWIKLVSMYSKLLPEAKHLNIEQMIFDSIS